MKRTIAAAAVVLLCCAGAHAKPGSGDLWEVTSQLSMEGMPKGMPARTHEQCTPKVWTTAPVPADESQKCEVIDFRNTPEKSVWKMKCAGPPAMTGNGEISRMGADAYKGVINMSSDEGNITINVSGRRLGDCDAEADQAKRDAQMAHIQAQAAAGQQMAEDARKQMCLAPVESLSLTYLNQMAANCQGIDFKTPFCNKLNSADGWAKTCVRDKSDPPNSLAPLAAYCAADAAALTKTNCEVLAKSETDLELIGHCCPEVARAIAQRECGGMKYTAQMARYGSFCATYAKDAVAAGAAPGPTPTPSPESATSKAKKKLKGIFGK